MKPIKLAASAAAGATFLLAAIASPSAVPASAAGPASLNPASVQYVSSTLHGTPGHTVLGTVACPAGTFVVSAAAAGNGPVTSLTPLRGARTSDSISNFTAVAATAAFSPTIPVSSATTAIFAGCAPAAQLTGAVSKTLQVTGTTNVIREGTVTCPSGMRAFGGGGHFVTPDHRYTTNAAMYSNSVTADGTGWYYRGYSSEARNRLFVTTSCAPLSGAYIASAKVAFTNHGSQTFAQCANGYGALSGGEQMLSTDGATGINVSGTIDSTTPTNNGWYVSGYSSGYPNLVLNSLAQCVPTT